MSELSHKGMPLRGKVIDSFVDVTDYEGALQRVLDFAKSGNVAAVAAANTHLIAEAFFNPEYAKVLQDFELVLPDGMPLVWSLQLDGHKIKDRVYGPYLMQYVLKHSPSTLRHFFLGGTEECLEKLQTGARSLNPDIKIAGVLSPPFGMWDEAVEMDLAKTINAANADFVWVALGGVRQETWIAQNRHRYDRGVFLAVGDAFTLVAGMRSFAPAWMQKAGLTWVYRLIQEPRRLMTRYLRYNSRFVFAFLLDRFRKVWKD